MRRFGKPEACPLWQHRFGPGRMVWQLAFAGKGVLLAVTRSAGSLHAGITALDPSSGRLLASGFRPDGGCGPGQEGFAGLETTSGGLVFCHAWYQQGPEHQGMWAFEAASARLLWSRPELTFAANLGDSLLLYRRSSFAGFPERHYFVIDPATGTVLDEPGGDMAEANRLRLSAPGEELLQGVLLPEPVAPDDALLQELGGGEALPAGTQCERIAKEGLLAIGLHEPESGAGGGSWRSSLLAWREGRLVHAVRMASGSPWPLLDNFLFRDGLLYYLEQKEQLVCLRLQ